MRRFLLHIICGVIVMLGYANSPDSFGLDIGNGSSSIVDTIAECVDDSVEVVEDTVKNELQRLTEEDYLVVAERLGIEVAVIKAVVEVEAGQSQCGFYDMGKPIINFDLKVFRKFANRNGIDLSKYKSSHAVVFAKPNVGKYGTRQAAQWARFDAACEIDSVTAIEGTFWGMFQIGGFNWQKCGAADIQEFYRLMCKSEFAQLEMFAEFLVNSNMVGALKKKNWSQFAFRYNGPKYKSRGYHTKLARAYKKHSS